MQSLPIAVKACVSVGQLRCSQARGVFDSQPVVPALVRQDLDYWNNRKLPGKHLFKKRIIFDAEKMLYRFCKIQPVLK